MMVIMVILVFIPRLSGWVSPATIYNLKTIQFTIKKQQHRAEKASQLSFVFAFALVLPSLTFPQLKLLPHTTNILIYLFSTFHPTCSPGS